MKKYDFFFASDTQKASISMYDPNNANTVYVGLLLLILEKNNRSCFFLPYIFTHSFIIQSCKSDFLFHPDSSSYLWWIALPELFFCFLYLFVGYVLYTFS